MTEVLMFAFSLLLFFLAIFVIKFIKELYKSSQNKLKLEEQDYSYDFNSNSIIKPILYFEFQNNTNEEIELNLCELDYKDTRYVFSTSTPDYKLLVEYLKSYTLNVFETTVQYLKSDWQKDIINLVSFNPFQKYLKPIYIAMDDFDFDNIHKNIISSKENYQFNYFNTLYFKLKPKEKKSLSLFINEDEIQENKKNVLCGVVLKNNSNEKQKISLFKDYLNINVEYNSLFDTTTYREIINTFKVKNLVAKEIRIFCRSQEIVYKINNDEFCMVSTYNQESKYYFIVDLENQKYIGNFEIDIQPDEEMIITFK